VFHSLGGAISAFFRVLLFSPKRPSSFFLNSPHQKTLFRMMEYHPKTELCFRVSIVNYLQFPIIKLVWNVWLGSLMVTCRTCNPEVTQRPAQVRLRTATLPGNDLRQVVYTHVPLSPSSIIWYRLHRWDVNRRTARYTGPVSVVSQCKNWCMAEGQGNGDQHRPMGRKAREGLYVFFTKQAQQH